MKNKPKITEIMMLAFTRERKWRWIDTANVPHNEVEEEDECFIVPLTGFTIREDENENELVIKIPDDIKPKFKKYKRFAISLTDDPRATWAGDWSDLGCFRLVYKFYDCRVDIEDGYLYVRNKRKKDDPCRDRDLIIPDKKRWF